MKDRYGFDCECRACEVESEKNVDMFKKKFEENVKLSYYFEKMYLGEVE